jgi:hypothetical protein
MRARVALYRDPTVNPAAAAAGVRQLAAGSDMAETGEGGWLGWREAGPWCTVTDGLDLQCDGQLAAPHMRLPPALHLIL